MKINPCKTSVLISIVESTHPMWKTRFAIAIGVCSLKTEVARPFIAMRGAQRLFDN